jgi:hypothetical protein
MAKLSMETFIDKNQRPSVTQVHVLIRNLHLLPNGSKDKHNGRRWDVVPTSMRYGHDWHNELSVKCIATLVLTKAIRKLWILLCFHTKLICNNCSNIFQFSEPITINIWSKLVQISAHLANNLCWFCSAIQPRWSREHLQDRWYHVDNS